MRSTFVWQVVAPGVQEAEGAPRPSVSFKEIKRVSRVYFTPLSIFRVHCPSRERLSLVAQFRGSFVQHKVAAITSLIWVCLRKDAQKRFLIFRPIVVIPLKPKRSEQLKTWEPLPSIASSRLVLLAKWTKSAEITAWKTVTTSKRAFTKYSGCFRAENSLTSVAMPLAAVKSAPAIFTQSQLSSEARG